MMTRGFRTGAVDSASKAPLTPRWDSAQGPFDDIEFGRQGRTGHLRVPYATNRQHLFRHKRERIPIVCVASFASDHAATRLHCTLGNVLFKLSDKSDFTRCGGAWSDFDALPQARNRPLSAFWYG